MARKLRVQYPGAIYLVMNRGDRCEAIFGGDKDRDLFLSTLNDTCLKTGWQVHGYCLMGNHFHLVVETPEPNLVSGMKWLSQSFMEQITDLPITDHSPLITDYFPSPISYAAPE